MCIISTSANAIFVLFTISLHIYILNTKPKILPKPIIHFKPYNKLQTPKKSI